MLYFCILKEEIYFEFIYLEHDEETILIQY